MYYNIHQMYIRAHTELCEGEGKEGGVRTNSDRPTCSRINIQAYMQLPIVHAGYDPAVKNSPPLRPRLSWLLLGTTKARVARMYVRTYRSAILERNFKK